MADTRQGSSKRCSGTDAKPGEFMRNGRTSKLCFLRPHSLKYRPVEGPTTPSRDHKGRAGFPAFKVLSLLASWRMTPTTTVRCPISDFLRRNAGKIRQRPKRSQRHSHGHPEYYDSPLDSLRVLMGHDDTLYQFDQTIPFHKSGGRCFSNRTMHCRIRQ